MNMPNTMAMKAIRRRGSMRSTSVRVTRTALGGPSDEGVRMGAWAMPRQLLLAIPLRSGRGIALGVDAGHYRHAWPQHRLARNLGRHADSDRHPLDNFREIAGRVVWRKQREH